MADLTKLSKEELIAHIEALYAKAKPHQDALADNAVEIIYGSREVFRRIITKHLPDVAFTRTRVVTRLSCTLNCMGNPSQELVRRLNKLAAEGIKIIRVEYDEVLHDYIFHSESQGDFAQPHEA